MAKCRVCGAAHRACGPTSTVTPVDQNVSENHGGTMTLKEYEVTVDGRHPHKTTMLLNEADAKRLGATEVKAAAKTASKSKTPANKAAKAPANKAKAPANKAKAPAANKKTETPKASAVEDASDPDASE